MNLSSPASGLKSQVSSLTLCVILLSSLCSVAFADANMVTLKNDHVLRELRLVDGVWRTFRFARADGSDAIATSSDEFHILPLESKQGWTVSDYVATGPPVGKEADGVTTLQITYRQRKPLPDPAPEKVIVTYSLGKDATHHKRVTLLMKKGEIIDRLQVERFSSVQNASRGGYGQPVFVGKWFFGLDYPGFYSWHSDGCVEPDYNYRWFYDIDMEKRDEEFTPRKGLVTLFHFPGYAQEQSDGTWTVVSKKSAVGISSSPNENAELAMLDYISRTRKPVRSHLHFNNWYSSEAKFLTTKNFVEKTARPLVENLARYGAHLDAMVPDHGWQNGKAFDYIYQPQLNPTHEPLPELRKALEKAGTKLGIWTALDGTNNSVARGKAIGYRSAYSEKYERSRRWTQGKDYFDILDPKYQADLKKSLRFLLVDAEVDYIKHDFNHNFTSHYITERHARERCLDVTLEILAYERSLNKNVFQNYTNGSWFSPWWLQHADTLWMMSGDSGNNTSWPQVSLRDNANTYRDAWIFQSFNNPERCQRPILPVANLMTHGILFSKKKPYTDFKDPLHEWSDYIVMHLARGTIVKELYVTLDLLDEAHWEVLGRAAGWAQRNQDRLLNTVYVGGDPGKGEVYGYVSWVDGRAILTARNPDRREQVLTVPFDASVYYRGKQGEPYHARAIYPFVEPMPWSLNGGETMSVTVPGDSVMVFEIEPGKAKVQSAVSPQSLPNFESKVEAGAFSLKLTIPDEKFPRFDLVLQPWGPIEYAVVIDGKPIEAAQQQQATRWTASRYDLREYRGRTISVEGKIKGDTAKRQTPLEAWLIADRQVGGTTESTDAKLPLPIFQHHRRVTQKVISKQP